METNQPDAELYEDDLGEMAAVAVVFVAFVAVGVVIGTLLAFLARAVCLTGC